MNKNSERRPAVYCLEHDGGVFYIGRTGVNVTERLWQHCYRARSGHNSPLYRWMREVGISNVSIRELQELSSDDDWGSIEAEWIKKTIDSGADLLNCLGRDGIPDSFSAEMKMASSQDRRGKQTWITGKRGVEAGWTQERRDKVAKSAQRKRESRVPSHGTLNEYSKHGCRCEACKSVALNPRQKVEVHGRYLYKRDKCRCDVCIQANREYGARWARNKKGIELSNSQPQGEK